MSGHIIIMNMPGNTGARCHVYHGKYRCYISGGKYSMSNNGIRCHVSSMASTGLKYHMSNVAWQIYSMTNIGVKYIMASAGDRYHVSNTVYRCKYQVSMT